MKNLFSNSSKTGIQSKLGRVLRMQLLFISLATALGVYAAALVVEKVMIGTALANEAAHFWKERSMNPLHPLPNTDNLRGYSLESSPDGKPFPAALRSAPLGRSRVDLSGRSRIVYVEERDNFRLWLVFDAQSVSRLSFWFGVVPLSLTLVVIYLSTWIVYRQSNKTLSPLTSLAQKMRGVDLQEDGLERLEFDYWRGPTIDDEVRVLAESLRDFTEQLKSQLQRERAFSRDVSHELRTPLAVLLGSLELLQKQAQLNPQQARVVERMLGTTRDMQSLIEILLLLAQTEHASPEHGEITDVNALADLLVSQIELSHNADQHVGIEIEHRAALSVEAPQPVIGMVLGNLLRNACNYTADGKVLVRVSESSVSVIDTGTGMQIKDLPRLQQPFQRQAENNPGYGLGLDIVSRLCERYGWVLKIHSSEGQGTQVDVRMVR